MTDVFIKDKFHIDEFIISNFCPNTIKLNGANENKFKVFSHLLNTFHNDETIYEKSPQMYSSFIIYKVLLDALLKNKNILSYEQYVFNILKGYSEQSEDKSLTIAQIVKIWNTIIQVYNILLDLAKDPHIQSIEYDQRFFTTLRHINVDRMSCNYYFNLPIVVHYENSVIPVLIIPVQNSNNSSNIFPYIVSDYFGKRVKKLIVLHLSLISYNYELSSINPTPKYLRDISSLINSLYIDFNKVNVFNCSYCPLSCTSSEILNTKYKIEPYNPKNRLIKIRK